MLALCLVAIVAVIAIPRYFGRPEVTLDNACTLLSRDLRAVQNRAALHKVGARLVFEEDGWSALDTSGRPIEGLGESHPILRRFSRDGVFDGVRVVDIACGSDHAVAIDTRGLVAESCEVVLGFAGETRRVAIERGGGQVLVYRPDSRDPTEARVAH
jgi:hypothetical protein